MCTKCMFKDHVGPESRGKLVYRGWAAGHLGTLPRLPRQQRRRHRPLPQVRSMQGRPLSCYLWGGGMWPAGMWPITPAAGVPWLTRALSCGARLRSNS